MAVGESRKKAVATEVLGPVFLAACLAAGAAVGATAAVAATAAAAPWANAVAVVAGASAAVATRAWADVAVAGGTAWDGKESPTDLELIKLSASLNNSGANPLLPHVHKAQVNSAPPADLFKRHQPHAPGSGHGKHDTCYFYDHASPIKSVTSKGVEKRDRKIAGGGKWHQENCKPIHGADGSVVGLKRRFSYQSTCCEPTGWILFEFSPVKKQEEEDGVAEMLLCTIHKSKCKKHPGASTTAAACSSAGEETPSKDPRESPGGGMQSPAQQAPAMPMPSLGIVGLTDTTDLLQQAEDFTERGLGFDRSTVPDSGISSSSGVKRKANRHHDHPEGPPSSRRGMTDKDRRVLQEVEHMLLYDDNLMPPVGADIGDTYDLFKDILNNAGGVSARFDAGMTGMTPARFDDVGDWARSPTGTSEADVQEQGLVEMAEGSRAPRRVPEESAYQNWTCLEDFFLENSTRWSLQLQDSGGDCAGLTAAEPVVVDNFVPVIELDGGDDLDWLQDYPIEDVDIERGFDQFLGTPCLAGE